MDQFSAHLDRGWDLVQRGDSHGAEMSARGALKLDSQSPEAYNLLGYVCALQGEFDEAIEHYRHALTLDDTYLEAMLNAAEVHIHPLGEFDEAIRMCNLAVDLAESDDEVVDALLLKFDALLGKNEPEAARELCASFPPGPFENPNHAFLVGRALFEIGDVQRAAPLIEEAASTTPANPEACYYLGLVRDERGDIAGATQAFLRARELDFMVPPPAWSLTPETFVMTAQKAVEALDPELRGYLRPAEIFVTDVPGVEVVVDGVDPRALVLLDGLTPAKDGEKPSGRVFVYQRNVERVTGSVEMVEAEIKAALEREISATFLDPERTPEPKDSLN